MPTKSTLGSAIASARERAALTQAALAAAVGVVPNSIARIERDEKGPSLATLRRIAGALGVSLDSLLRGVPV